jgi:lipopolysaccharide transport system ATP-binding protein
MSALAIRASNLGKRYVIGRAFQRHRTLREALSERVGGIIDTLRPESRGIDDSTFWALRDVSFEVAQGEAVALIGGNGAGKSTLLKLLSRITAPTTGRGEIHGRLGSLLEVGTGFHPDLSGRENVFLNGAILGMRRSEVDRKFDEIVAFAEVERFIDVPVKRYSSGMYLRLAFAVAAHLEPEVLLVDEVLAVGDAAFQKKCLGKMSDVTAAGRTVVFVSHNMDAVLRLCSRALLLERGRVAKSGNSADVVVEYLARGGTTARPNSWIDLSDATRSGSGEARFSRVRYSVPDDPASVPRPGGPISFDVEIAASAALSVASLAVTVRSQTGMILISPDIIEKGQALSLPPGRCRVRFDLDALHLNAGIYSVSLWMGHAVGQPMDNVSAFDLDVLSVQSGSLGVTPKALIPCHFTFHSLPQPDADDT